MKEWINLIWKKARIFKWERKILGVKIPYHLIVYWGIVMFTSVILFVGCNDNKDSLDCEDILSVKFEYLPKGLDPVIPVSDCNYIFYYSPVVKDTIINDSKIICELISLVNNFQATDTEAFFDFRISIRLEDINGNSHRLCLGEDDLVVFDGELMKNENALFDFIDALLY